MARTPANDAYAGINIENLRQLTLVGWASAFLIDIFLLSYRPPTAVFGDLGWWLAILNIGPHVVGMILLARRPHLFSFDVLLGVAWLMTVSLAVAQWQCGGWGAPYHEMLLPVLLLAVAGHPIRRSIPLVVGVGVIALLPALYDPNTGQLVQMLLELGAWAMVAALCAGVMVRVRQQRLALDDLARSDQLTSLANRRAFDERIAERDSGVIALAIADVDDFKGINDVLGHLEGDRVLAEIAAALVEVARHDDEVFRWGGDEFAVLLGRVDEGGAEALCLRLEAGVADRVRRPDGSPVHITFGWACGSADGDFEALTAQADALLRDRKAGVTRSVRVAA